MAFDSSNLTLLGYGNGFGLYRYDTTESTATVDAAGYFNNDDDNVNLAVGDIIKVVVWGTAVRTGTISDYGEIIVNSVSSGVVDTTNEVHAITVADTR